METVSSNKKAKYASGGAASAISKKRKASKSVYYQSKDTGPERKVIDYTHNTTLGTTGYLSCLNAMQQGTNQGQRIGVQIDNVGIRIRLSMFNSLTNLNTSTGIGGNSDFFRIFIVYDHQPNQTGSGVAGMFNPDNGTAYAPWSEKGFSTKDRFDVLYDSGMQMICSGGPNCTVLDKHINCKLPTRYASTSNVGTVADVVTGAIWLFAWGSNTNGNLPSVMEGHSRVYFVDE